MDKVFRTPNEMKARDKRAPLSARVRLSTLKVLERAAKDGKLPLSQLVSNVLDDYAAFLERQRK